MDMHSVFPLDLVIKSHKCADYFYLEIWNKFGFQVTQLLYEVSYYTAHYSDAFNFLN